MECEEFDPELVKKAKALSAGPLGKEMAKFPLRFAKAAFFGEKPSKDKYIKVNNGTITLVELEGHPIGVTCFHVIDAYRQINDGENYVFQIGNLEFNPLERVIGESPKMDLVSIDLKGINVNELIMREGIGSEFFVPPCWPPKKIKSGDYVVFGGFPGKWRQYLSWNEIVFDSWSSGGSKVSSVSEKHFICQFEREFWVESFNLHDHDGLDLHQLGGLSGGPVFIHRGLYWELIGIIYEFSEGFDLMYIRPADLLNYDGTIRNDII